jgi:hypothetical protein
MAENDDNTKLIRIIVGQYKASPESFGVFKALANLALTSKTYNNLLDKLLLSLSCNYIRGNFRGLFWLNINIKNKLNN